MVHPVHCSPTIEKVLKLYHFVFFIFTFLFFFRSVFYLFHCVSVLVDFYISAFIFVNGFIIFPLTDISVSINGNHTAYNKTGGHIFYWLCYFWHTDYNLPVDWAAPHQKYITTREIDSDIWYMWVYRGWEIVDFIGWCIVPFIRLLIWAQNDLRNVGWPQVALSQFPPFLL